MDDKFQNKYRVPSSRLTSWDYKSQAGYFITICTKNREHYFGTIENCVVRLSEMGMIAKEEWLATSELRKDMNLQLDEFIIMPNHFHAIIWIGRNDFNSVETQCIASLRPTDAKFGPQSKNLSAIIRGYKSAVTTFARKNKLIFDWQDRFYDNIIRNDSSYKRIKEYIISNPGNWNTDRFFR